MRRFGRPCRGQGKVVVSLVRQTETQLRETGQAVVGLARAAPACVPGAAPLTEDPPGRLATQLSAARAAHQQSATPSRRLTQGKPLPQGKIVKAYAPPIAPICQGKSNCPTPFGRKPGLIAEPAAGFLFAFQLPVGTPAEPSSVVPVVDKVQPALEQTSGPPTRALHALAGGLALHDPKLRAALQTRGILTVGSPHTVEPLPPAPPPEGVRRRLTAAGLNRKRTLPQVQRACAWGSSRPVGESISASLLCRGAARSTDKGHRGALGQMGMAVIAPNAATLRRIYQDRLSKRAQKLRHLLRLKRHNTTEFNVPKN